MDKLGIDTSKWNPRLDISILKDAGVETVVVKLGQGRVLDPMFYKNAEIVAKGGLILQTYYWDEITFDPSIQAEWVAETIGKSSLPVSFVWNDMEQWWTDWTKWRLALLRKIAWSAVPSARPANISSHYQAFMQTLDARMPDRAGIYTNWGFISSWARPMSSWIGKYLLWNPQYSNQPPKGTVCDWPEFKAKYVPTKWPFPPLGTTAAKMVGYQFTGDVFKLPGVYDQLGRRLVVDVNLFKEEFLASIAVPGAISIPTVPKAPDVPPAPVKKDTYIVTAWALNIRKGPGTNYGYAGSALPQNTVIHVAEIIGSWAHLTSGAWCYAPYLSPV